METTPPALGQRLGLLGRSSQCALLDALICDVRQGRSRSLMLRGEAGVGKTALLEYLVETGSELTVLRAAGVESEIELAYAGVHQLCAPILDRRGSLPEPQSEALEIVFGLSLGVAPSRFLVGLAVLSLLTDASDEQPVLCVVDDAQWLDESSALTLGFVARRLLAEPVGLVIAARDEIDEFRRLGDLNLSGLADVDARALLSSVAGVVLDEQVRDRIVAETRGNPLALLELPRGLGAAELAGFGPGAKTTLPSSVEESFRRRIAALPAQTRLLLTIAAAEPLGQPVLLWQAAALQGIGTEAAVPAVQDGLCEFAPRVRFRHPLVRAAAYGTGTPEERRQAHAAIAEATDPKADPDRRAWHNALATRGANDAVADELERSAARARARAGAAAEAVFLERSVTLTLDPARRAERALAAAEARFLSGAAERALELAAVAQRGPLNEAHDARLDVLRGQVATMQRNPRDAAPRLLGAAQRLRLIDRGVARDTYRDAFIAASFAGRLAGDIGLVDVAVAVRDAALSSDPPTVSDDLLEAAALLVAEGWSAGAAPAQRALAACCTMPVLQQVELHWLFFANRTLAAYLWDPEAWDAITGRMMERARDGGVLGLQPLAAAQRVGWCLFAGDLAAASALVAEQNTLLDAIGGRPWPGSGMAIAAFRGRPAEVARIDAETTRGAISRGDGAWVALRYWSTALLCNGSGRYDEALKAAQLGAEYPPDLHASSWALSELVEAAARCGRPEAAAPALARLAQMARACGTNWIAGVEARARALMSDPADAEELYLRAINHLERTPFQAELARAHLLYGEWLRRRRRRIDARTELRAASDMLTTIGMEAFAERARKELMATGEHARRRTVETRDDLTLQERQIAQLARDGLSNPDIGARLFLSPRTVEWHLRTVFGKLGIRSRHQLADALADPTS